MEILYFVTSGVIKSFRSKEQVENETPKNDQKVHEDLKKLTKSVQKTCLGLENMTKSVRQLEQKMMHLEGHSVIIEEL